MLFRSCMQDEEVLQYYERRQKITGNKKSGVDGISVCSDQRSGNGGIGMETYLEKLLSQIRCKKARPYIAEEIKDHIESQIADNLSEGMSYEEAEKNAVTDMGDPVEVGISLDRIHKPKIAWKLLVIVGILSLLGLLLQQSILRQPGYQELEIWMQERYQIGRAHV